MKKRAIVLTLVLCMVCTVFATAVTADDAKSFIVLGDSTSTGFGLKDPQKENFVNVIATTAGMAVNNFAVDGLTSTQLAEAVKAPSAEQKAAIEAAKFISISIGGNDLIGALFTAVGTAIGSADKAAINQALALAASGDAKATETLAKALESVSSGAKAIVSQYSKNLTETITALKGLNATAPIVLQTIYNPYNNIKNEALVTATESLITAMNQIIKTGETTGAYVTVDVYSAFKGASSILTNATNSETPMDPHPNAEGHKVIAALYGPLLSKIAVPASPPSSNSPQTGDSTTLLPIFLMLGIGIIIFACGRYSQKTYTSRKC